MVVSDQAKRPVKSILFWLTICGLVALLSYLASTDNRSWRWKVFDVAFPIWGTVLLTSLRVAWQGKRERSSVGK